MLQEILAKLFPTKIDTKDVANDITNTAPDLSRMLSGLLEAGVTHSRKVEVAQKVAEPAPTLVATAPAKPALGVTIKTVSNRFAESDEAWNRRMRIENGCPPDQGQP
jgi:hypothetical protein